MRRAATSLTGNRGFVVGVWLIVGVSFWQRGEGAPESGRLQHEPQHGDRVWCEHCHHQQPYRPRFEPDPEFPYATWGDCAVCGREVLVWSDEVLTPVGPDV
jgi:hypothetical protein